MVILQLILLEFLMYFPLPSASETSGQERFVEELSDIRPSQMHIFLMDLCRASGTSGFCTISDSSALIGVCSVLGQNSPLLLSVSLSRHNSFSMASSMSSKGTDGPRELLGFPSLDALKERGCFPPGPWPEFGSGSVEGWLTSVVLRLPSIPWLLQILEGLEIFSSRS